MNSENLTIHGFALRASTVRTWTTRSWLITRTALAIAVTAMTYTGVAYFVNPLRDFEIQSKFPPVGSGYQGEKSQLFTAFSELGPVDGIVLGSSQSMLLNSERLRQLSGGARFFNFASGKAKAEDFLASLRFVHQKGQKPKNVLIGVDVECLREAEPQDITLHPIRELAVGSVDPFARLRMVTERVFSLGYVRDTGLSIFLRLAHRKPATVIHDDGTLQYRGHDEQRYEGTFRFEQEMPHCITTGRAAIANARELSTSQIRYLHQTVWEARKSGAHVTLWLAGPHPRTAAYMAAGTSYPQLVAQTWWLLRQEDSAALNLHDPSAYGGPANGWYDCNHFDNSHAILIERILLGGQVTSQEPDWPEPGDGNRSPLLQEIAEGKVR